LIHIRAVSPPDMTPMLVESLGANRGVVNLVVLQGVAKSPDGDSLEFDVITAEANRVLDELRRRCGFRCLRDRPASGALTRSCRRPLKRGER
jgi:hypothetical protein